MTIDVAETHRYKHAKNLGVGYDLDGLKTGGRYAADTADNGPVASGSYYIDVYVGESGSDVVIQRATDKTTKAQYWRGYDGSAWDAAWLNQGSPASVAVTLANTGAVTVDSRASEYVLTTDGTGNAGQILTLSDGYYVGQRLLVTYGTEAHASDTAVITITSLRSDNIYATSDLTDAPASLTFDVEDEYAYFEWTGVYWNVLYLTGAIVT